VIVAATLSLSFAAVNFDCADPAALADFWGRILGRPVSPGALGGDMAVDATDSASGPRLVLHPVSKPGTVKNRLRPILLTDHHDEETKRLTDLGASVRPPSAHVPATVRLTTFADPEGNEFDLVTFQPS
jgi:predicted enzyme related to lactoylglutathione lyase